MKVFYSPDYVLAAHEFETTRKAAWVAESLREAPIPGVELVAPVPLTEDQVCAVHDPACVTAVRSGQPHACAESQGFAWDAGLWPMVLASNGGMVAAALAALREGVAGSLSSGMHHAGRDYGKGYCTFNGLALAARAARDAGARSVLILDLDAHCGGGTHSLVRDDPAIQHVDVAVNRYDCYVPVGRHALELVTEPGHYLPAIEAGLDALEERDFDLCLYNAGMDPVEQCPVGGPRGITRAMLAERERLVCAWCARRSIPVAFALAGGYIAPWGGFDRADLVDLHRLTIAAAADQSDVGAGGPATPRPAPAT